MTSLHTHTGGGGSYQLVVGDVGTIRVGHEPPGSRPDRGDTHVDTNTHVSEEQPA